MKTKLLQLLALTLLMVSCARTRKQADLSSMTDRELKRIVRSQGNDYAKVKTALQIDVYQSKIMEGCAFGFPVYRFDLGSRFLFLDVKSPVFPNDKFSDLVIRANFVEKPPPVVGEPRVNSPVETSTGEVRKP